MKREDLAKEGIWIIIVDGKIHDERYDEKSAIREFEMLIDHEDFKLCDIILTRVLRTTKINEYKNLDTFGDFKICPSIERAMEIKNE